MNIKTNDGDKNLTSLPHVCPHCHRSITPVPLIGHKSGNTTMEVFCYCPDVNCRRSFIAFYNTRTNDSRIDFNNRTSLGNLLKRSFSDIVKEISESFVTIYNQAYSAEQYGLLEICGVGYRKALEFLIKEHAIQTHPTEQEAIEKKLLGTVISNYVNDARVKSVAKRAAWLGNDETHYIRKWEGKNLEDLKKLIDLTIHWLEMEALTNSFDEEMPDPNE
jgi:hypothetical protein